MGELVPAGGGYVFEEGWARLPDGVRLGDVGGVAVDAQDNVYVFNRGDHPMVVLARDGTFLGSWGQGVFRIPHGVRYERDGFLYCTDEGDHTVRKCTTGGRVVLQIGTSGPPKPFMSGEPFNRCTDTALAPNGDVYVADGYGNSRVHRFDSAGKLLASFGACGSDPGQFYVAHNICVDPAGTLYVADRENHRIQLFGDDGTYRGQWNNLMRPMAMTLHEGVDGVRIVVGEAGPSFGQNYPNLGPRISILDTEGRVHARFPGGGYGHAPDRLLAPHGLCVDSRGDIYVGEVANAAWRVLHKTRESPDDLRTLRKLRRVEA